MSKRETFLGGAFMLAVAGVVSRVLGALFRIPLYPLLGSEGMGLFQMAYPIYALILVVSTTGVNVAVSKLVAERVTLGDRRGARDAFRTSLWLLVSSGLAFSLLLFAASGYIAGSVTRDPRARLSIAAISPAVLFVSAMSAYRGMFQGLQMMTPTAVSQMIEQVVRVATMIALGYALLPAGVELAAAGASFGAVTGAVAGLGYLLWVSRQSAAGLDSGDGDGPAGSMVETAKQIAVLAVPVSLASGVLGIIQLVDMAVVPARLQAAGYSPAAATSMYGQLTGGALPLVNLATVFTAALQVSLVPAVAEAAALGDRRMIVARSRAALRITFILMVPAVAGLYLLAGPIPQFLFGDPGIESSLSALSPGVLFLAVQQVTSGVLQGLGDMAAPVRNLAWGAALKFILTWVLTPVPSVGIRGAAYGTSIGFLVAGLLNTASLASRVGLEIIDVPGMLLKPCGSAAVMGVVVIGAYRWLMAASGRNSVATVGAICAAMLAYGAALAACRGLTSHDFEAIPRVGPRVAAFLVRLGLISR